MDQQQSDFTESIDLFVAHGKQQSLFYLLLVIVSDKRFYTDDISKPGFLHTLREDEALKNEICIQMLNTKTAKMYLLQTFTRTLRRFFFQH